MKAGINNKYDSPMYDLLRTVLIFDMVNVVMNFTAGTRWYEKSIGKNDLGESLVYRRQRLRYRISYFKSTNLLANTMVMLNISLGGSFLITNPN